MRKKLIVLILAITLAAGPAVAVYAAEDYHDGNSEQIYVWVQEGDARFCYLNNGGWSEHDMLTGFHTINGEVYYFYEQEMDNAQYGQMATGEVWVGDFTFIFDSEGHMIECYQGPEQE